jgi:hypothetical protein
MSIIEQEDIYVNVAFKKLSFLQEFREKERYIMSSFFKCYFITSGSDEEYMCYEQMNAVVFNIISKDNIEKTIEFLKQDPLEVVEIYKLKKINSNKKKRFQERLKKDKDNILHQDTINFFFAPTMNCNQCGSLATICCSVCMKVYYCGASCQKANRKSHKKACKKKVKK